MALISFAALVLYLSGIRTLSPSESHGNGWQDYCPAPSHFSTGSTAQPDVREPSQFARACRAVSSSIAAVVALRRAMAACRAVVLLSGSLLGILGLMVGCAFILVFLKQAIAWRMCVLILVAAVLITGLGHFFGIDFMGTIAPRVVQLFESGPEATNRGYVYDYVVSAPPPLLGYGLGNANLLFSVYRHSDLVSSHISLFVNMWFSLGVVGLVLMSLYVAYPVLTPRLWANAARDILSTGLFTGVVTWLVMFAGHAEELTVMFGVVYALIWAHPSPGAATMRRTWLNDGSPATKCMNRRIESTQRAKVHGR